MDRVISKYSAFYLLIFYIKILFSNCGLIFKGLYFAVVTTVLAHLISSDHSSAMIIFQVLMITLTNVIITFNSTVCEDQRDGFLDLIYLSGINLYWYILIKLFIGLIVTLILTILTLILLAIALQIDLALLKQVFIAIITILPPIASVLLFVNIIADTYASKVMQYVLSIPLIVPLIITCVLSIDDSQYLPISIGLNFIYLPVFIYLNRKMLEHTIISY